MTVGELIRALWDIKNKNMEVVTKLGDREFKVHDAYCSDEKTILFLNQKDDKEAESGKF